MTLTGKKTHLLHRFTIRKTIFLPRQARDKHRDSSDRDVFSSDRFVWRRFNTTSEGLVSIAAYAYDEGVKPYSPPNPNLLQVRTFERFNGSFGRPLVWSTRFGRPVFGVSTFA
jgi:hypothetical protein